MNGAGWSGPGDQFLYNQQPQDDLYSRFGGANHSTFDHYNVPPPQQQPHQQQQPAYPALSYSNSPYATQYQHARPSDMFAPPTNGHVDPSLQPSSQFQPPDRSFSVTPNSTISPQYLQYGVPPNQQPVGRAVSSDFNRPANTMSPNNFNPPQDHRALYFNPAAQNLNVQRPPNNVIQYPNLPIDPRQAVRRNMDGESPMKMPRTLQSREIQAPSPLRITHPDLLAKRTTSSRPQMSYAPFVYFQDETVQVPLGLKSKLISVFREWKWLL